MSSSKEIREGLAKLCFYTDAWESDDWSSIKSGYKEPYYNYADDILKYLNDNGVVLKVDRELPDWDFGECDWPDKQFCEDNCPLLKAGYTAIEPLI